MTKEFEGDKPVTTIEYIRKNTPRVELLAQLAEEATELAHAALKLRRAVSKTSPTPVSPMEALDGIYEEIADIKNCLLVLDLCTSVEEHKAVATIMREKRARWVERIEENR